MNLEVTKDKNKLNESCDVPLGISYAIIEATQFQDSPTVVYS